MDETKKVEEIAEEKPEQDLGEKIWNSKPVRFIRRHGKGFVAGIATTVAVATVAAVTANKAETVAASTPLFDEGSNGEVDSE